MTHPFVFEIGKTTILMVAIICMSMIMNPAGPVVPDMGGHNQQHSCYQQRNLAIMPDLFGKKKPDSGQE